MHSFSFFIKTGFLILGLIGTITSAGYPGEFVQNSLTVGIATNRSRISREPVHIVLTWPESDIAHRYNLYRKTDPNSPYNTCINGNTPISIMTNCTQIQTILTVNSEEWIRIGNILGNEKNPFDPCTVSGIPKDSTPYERLQLLARIYWKIAVTVGQGYDDLNVEEGITYYYELRAVDARGNEMGVLATGIQCTAGSPDPLPAPTSIQAFAGDSKVLLLWNSVKASAGFHVYRATAEFGEYQQINPSSFTAQIAADLEDKAIPPSNGFLDFQYWDNVGNPTGHMVKGVNITGPFNDVTYYYKIASVDLLGQEGFLSSPAKSATPVDKTPPMTIQSITITANDPMNQLELRWDTVTRDINGRLEKNLTQYRIYRYEIPDVTITAKLIGTVPQPAKGIQFVNAVDADPILRPPYGEKTFWYRIECVDANNNVSALSASSGGYLNDIFPPDSPRNVAAEGLDDRIHIQWDLNPEPDLDGYIIYRSLCDFGKWVCDPERQGSNKDKPCPDYFKMIGYISQDEAKELAQNMGGFPFYDDMNVPTSSLCYAYLIKAIDKKQNQSGSMPPNLSLETVVCQRLRDHTPPQPAIISGLFARDNGILVEWIGAPVQDIAAYQVYRSETENGNFLWVGGLTVVKPPAIPIRLTQPYQAPQVSGCEEIPLELREDMSQGSFLDTRMKAKQIYWYKVLGIDQRGNQSNLSDAVPVSTFTFSTTQSPAPMIDSITVRSPTCALVIHWTPNFNPDKHKGFLVFRSIRFNGTFQPISYTIPGNEFVDTQVVRGVEYWYKVMLLDAEGNSSLYSAAVNGKP